MKDLFIFRFSFFVFHFFLAFFRVSVYFIKNFKKQDEQAREEVVFYYAF